jgi:hypothetical protein
MGDLDLGSRPWGLGVKNHALITAEKTFARTKKLSGCVPWIVSSCLHIPWSKIDKNCIWGMVICLMLGFFPMFKSLWTWIDHQQEHFKIFKFGPWHSQVSQVALWPLSHQHSTRRAAKQRSGCRRCRRCRGRRGFRLDSQADRRRFSVFGAEFLRRTQSAGTTYQEIWRGRKAWTLDLSENCLAEKNIQSSGESACSLPVYVKINK